MNEHGAEHAISRFRDIFLSTDHLRRSEKHIANPMAGSSAKRINMILPCLGWGFLMSNRECDAVFPVLILIGRRWIKA
jgi:hypothetical protein